MKLSNKLNKKRILTAMIVLAIISSILGNRLSGPLSSTLRYALIPLGSYGQSGASTIRQAFSVEHNGLSAAQAEKLHRQIEDLQQKNQLLQRQRDHWWKQTRHIQKIRNVKALAPSRETYELIPASVVLSSSMPYGNQKTVDAGELKKVHKGMQVLEIVTDRSKALQDWNVITANASALVGRIEDSGRFASRVMLVTDKNFSISGHLWREIDPSKKRMVIIKRSTGPIEEELTARNNRRPIDVKVYGSGGNQLLIYDVPKHHNVLPGDRIWTIPNTPILPAQFLIGKVTEVTQSPKNANFVDLIAEPLGDLDSIRDVYVVRPTATLPPRRPRGTN